MLVNIEFARDTLIKEENGNLKPYHDIYMYAFMQIHFEDYYMEELNNFLQFCIQEKINNSILLSNILSILIEKENILRGKYLNLAQSVCADYYSKSQYIAAKNLALMLLPDLDSTPYSSYNYNNLELLYIYAMSEKYSMTHVGSTKYFQLIADIGSIISLTSHEKGIVQEVHSELITNYLYSLDFVNFEKELLYFDTHLKNKTDIGSSEHKINAYLNFLNRKILYAFFKDMDDLESIYLESYNESKKLHRDDYQAYADMDYAKMLLTQNIEESIRLFNRALPIFKKYTKCHKRQIDCMAEIVFSEYLLYQKSYDQLYDLQKKALNNKFVHVYTKITLILLTLELLEEQEAESIEMKLTKLLIDYPDFNSNNRLALFSNQLFSAIYFLKNDHQKQYNYAYKQQQIAEKLSKTYLEVPKHNQIEIKSRNIIWKHEKKQIPQESFWLDPRIW